MLTLLTAYNVQHTVVLKENDHIMTFNKYQLSEFSVKWGRTVTTGVTQTRPLTIILLPVQTHMPKAIIFS